MNGLADLLGHIRRGDTAAAAAALAANSALANARDDKGDSPVLVATYHGKQDLVRLLLDRGARPSFFEACALGLDADVGQELRRDPSAIRQFAHDGWTPLHLAAFFGHPATVEALLDAGADVLAVSRNGEDNLPINAAAAGPRADRRPAIVRLLISRGAPVDGRGSLKGHTPLHEAAYNGDVALVRLLLESGADRRLRSGDGQTALEIATLKSHDEVARLLRA
jgi:ankyrin repeat protein